jgi:hypothetical protein
LNALLYAPDMAMIPSQLPPKLSSRRRSIADKGEPDNFAIPVVLIES